MQEKIGMKDDYCKRNNDAFTNMMNNAVCASQPNPRLVTFDKPKKSNDKILSILWTKHDMAVNASLPSENLQTRNHGTGNVRIGSRGAYDVGEQNGLVGDVVPIQRPEEAVEDHGEVRERGVAPWDGWLRGLGGGEQEGRLEIAARHWGGGTEAGWLRLLRTHSRGPQVPCWQLAVAGRNCNWNGTEERKCLFRLFGDSCVIFTPMGFKCFKSFMRSKKEYSDPTR